MGKRKWIYPDAGLGNRLNCLYSGLYWKRALGIDMEILWEVEYACCIEFEKLFRPIADVSVKTVYTLSVKKDHHLRSLFGKLYIAALKKKIFYCSSEMTSAIYKKGGEPEIRKKLNAAEGYCIKSSSHFADWEHISEVINEIKPTEEIEKRVLDIMNPYMDKRVIGVHIRRTDHKEAILHSPLELFIEKMQKDVNEDSDTVFYLATDDEEVENIMAKKFPLVEHKNFADRKSRRTEEGMKDAYVDMLCLSRCEKIYGSYGSTFSNMASLIGKIKCETIYRD
jgi:hypothetical protein